MGETPGLDRKLRQILVARFDEGGLKDLCFDLGIDYESLPDEGKANKARELILLCMRTARLTDLIQAGQAQRPDIAWPEVEPTAQLEGQITAPRKWILVVGTGSKALSPKVDETAELLGRSLAAHGFGLVTGGWAGVDEQVARAFSKELAEEGRPLEDFLTLVAERGQVPAFLGGDLAVVNVGTFGDRIRNPVLPWAATALSIADAVVVIEGAGGAYKIAVAALELGMPVLPLADTGRDARKLYWELSTSRQKNDAAARGLSKKQLAIAAREAPGVVEDIIELLDELFPLDASQAME